MTTDADLRLLIDLAERSHEPSCPGRLRCDCGADRHNRHVDALGSLLIARYERNADQDVTVTRRDPDAWWAGGDSQEPHK